MDGMDMQDESGEQDNLLSINPNDPDMGPIVKNWQDGGTYTVVLQVEQITPGKLKVTSMKVANGEGDTETPAEDQAPGEEAEPTASSARGATGNPAVDRMMEA